MENKELAEKLRKPIIRKSEKRKVHLSFIFHVWGSDLADIQLFSKFDKGIRFFFVLLVFVINTNGMGYSFERQKKYYNN